jgi:hypothetical protein
MSVTTTQLLSSGKFCKLDYDIILIPVKSASANVSLYTNNSKMSNFELWHFCRKWAICIIIWSNLVLRKESKIFSRDSEGKSELTHERWEKAQEGLRYPFPYTGIWFQHLQSKSMAPFQITQSLNKEILCVFRLVSLTDDRSQNQLHYFTLLTKL